MNEFKTLRMNDFNDPLNENLRHLDGHFEPLDDCLGPLAYLLRLPDGDGGCSVSVMVVGVFW